jgi:glycosyltransferase involved in cell wall biosynthesis
MKILLGVLYYEPAWAYGGPPKMVTDLARHLARRGHDVTVCTTDALDADTRLPIGEAEIDGVRVLRFRNASNALAWRLKIFLPIGMRRWLDDNIARFDVVHLFETRTTLNAWASRAAAAAGVPFVLSVWGSLPRGEGWRALVKRRYDRQHARTLFGSASALLAQNEHEAQLYSAFGGDARRVVLWPLGVDPEEFASLPERGRLRAPLGLGDDVPLALFVGRINELKGLAPLIRAFAHAAMPSAHLVIVGRDDGFLDAAQAIARSAGVADRVHFPGPLYGADAVAAYVDCDLFCITPTHFEETSLASLAAAACGRPILINDRCGVPWLEEFDAGVSVANDEGAIAAAMRSLLTDPARRARMGANARRMVEERFLAPRVVDQLEAIYQRVIAARAVATEAVR